MTTPKQQNRSDRQHDQSTDKTKGGKDQMTQGGQQTGHKPQHGGASQSSQR